MLFSRLGASVLILLSTGIVSQRQSVAQSQNKRPSLSQAQTAPPSSPQNLITTKYDKFKDQTAVQLGPILLPSPLRGCRLELTFLFTHDGQVMLLPSDDVVMSFTSTCSERLFSSNDVLLALLDGKRERFGKSFKYEVNVSGRYYVEDMFKVTGRDALMKIANSRTAEFQLGAVEFNLQNSQLALLREFGERMVAVPTGGKAYIEVIAWETKPDDLPGYTQVSGDIVNVSEKTLDGLYAEIECKLPDGNTQKSNFVMMTSTLKPQECAHFAGRVKGESNSCEGTFRTVRNVLPTITRLRQKTEAERKGCPPSSRSADSASTTKDLLVKARELYQAGRDDEALLELRRIVTIEPTNPEVYLISGRINLRRGDHEAAIKALKTAIFWEPKLIDAHILLGRIFLERGDRGEATKYASTAMRIDSNNQEAIALEHQVMSRK